MVDISRRTALKALGGAGLVGTAGCLGSFSGNDGKTTIRLVTSAEDTSAYQMSQGMAAVINEHSDTLSLDARPSDGSFQSMTMLDNGEADIAYTDTLNAYNIVNGEEEYADNRFENEIQQVIHYYDLNVGLVTRADSGVEDITDIADVSVSPGPVGTSTRKVMEEHLAHGIDVDSLDTVSLGFSEGGEALQEGRAEVVPDLRLNATVTPSYIEELYSIVDDATLVHWPEDVVESIRGDSRLVGNKYPADQMEGPDYGDRGEEWWTETVFSLYATDALDAETLTELLTTMWDNVDALAEYHVLLEDWADAEFLSQLNSELPVHPGAETFFGDIGASI